MGRNYIKKCSSQPTYSEDQLQTDLDEIKARTSFDNLQNFIFNVVLSKQMYARPYKGVKR